MLKKTKSKVNIAKNIPAGTRIAVVVSLFNRKMTRLLEEKCIQELFKAGIRGKKVNISYTPGAFEIPLECQKLINNGVRTGKPYSVVIALGVVIKGDTYHFELIANECARGVMEVMLKTETPIVFEILAGELDDMKKRTGDDRYNKGIEAAKAALEILDSAK